MQAGLWASSFQIIRPGPCFQEVLRMPGIFPPHFFWTLCELCSISAGLVLLHSRSCQKTFPAAPPHPQPHLRVAFLHSSPTGMGPTLVVKSCRHRTPQPCHRCSGEKQGVPSRSCARCSPATALWREQHQELQLWPLPGAGWEKSIPLVEFQALL